MPRDAYVAARCSEIDEILLYAADKGDTDPELGAHMAGYVSVLISGVVEDCIEHLVVQRARKVNDPQLQEFVRSSIAQQFRNPRSEDIANVIGRFSKDYQSSYQLSVGQEAREALGGVVKSAVIPARVGIRINLGPNTTLLVRILDSRLRGNDGNMTTRLGSINMQ